MPRALCPACEALEHITTTDIALEYRTDTDFGRIPVGSARYWQICMHPDKRQEKVDGRWPICAGSGRSV